MADSQAILATAARAYLAAPPPVDAGRSWTIGHTLDRMLDLSLKFDETDLSGCLLILALARRQPHGLDRCGLALRHALADLEIDLPLPAEPDTEELTADHAMPHQIYTEKTGS